MCSLELTLIFLFLDWSAGWISRCNLLVSASIRHHHRYYLGYFSTSRFHRHRIVSVILIPPTLIIYPKLNKFSVFVPQSRFAAINCGIVYLYCLNFQKIDEDEYGGVWELLKEGFITSFACFSVTWIVFFTGLHFDDVNTPKTVF